MRGFCWHVHHGILLEWCHDYGERVGCIKSSKLKEEQELRLRLFQPVKGQLPKPLIQAWATRTKAEAVCDKARDDYAKTEATCVTAEAICDKARDDYDKAEAVCDKAKAAYRDEIEALHKVECPYCPWDGHTIFADNKR